MKIEILKDVEMDGDIPVQRAYVHIDGKKMFGPLSSDEVTTLVGIMKKCLMPGEFSEEAAV